ncbi:MAG TPA: 4Fe-4S dicluster domain-containing protein [Anaerolineales bacterium]|nr:4Fe-4S dicluster domain-containing protein [Anaerolineales bacterium]HRK90179.1 4Fe-4S dicluster domain-containing protein [Anaerolineales bacterium]
MTTSSELNMPEIAMAEKEAGKWGMVIDQDICTGCQACVAACAMENNIAFVGEEDSGYGRAMHWIRIERFWEGEYPEVKMTNQQPMMCQQCGSAPCEPVCPAFATVHSMAESLNLQVYNRCVGTRYCANNCPYQVRAFNWRDYKRPEPLPNQLNPDVTVRRVGVMEKCTFCIQRIFKAQDQAKAEGREVMDGEFTTACAQACPASAIVFGRVDDPQSLVSQLKERSGGKTHLKELGTLPNVTYFNGG